MEKTRRTKEHSNSETPRNDQLAKQSSPQLTHRTSPYQTKQRSEPEAPNLKVISDPFEHQLSETSINALSPRRNHALTAR